MEIKKSFDKIMIKKILRGAIIAGLGAMIIYILEAIPSIDFGFLTATMVAIASILVNTVKEYYKKNK